MAMMNARIPEDVSAILLDQANRLFQQHVTKERLARADRGEWIAEIWDALVEAGLHRALLSEDAGGDGLGASDALLLLRRAAYFSVPVPLGEAMIASALWADAGGEVSNGVWSIAAESKDLRLSRDGKGYRVIGELRRVPWGARADCVLVHVPGDEHGTLVALPRSGATTSKRNLAYEPRDTIALHDILLPESAVRPAPPSCRNGLMVFGALIRSQQMIGAMERCFDYALTYANQRKQFGRTIGKFQAIQHLLAEAAGHCAAATAAADGASETYGHKGLPFAVALAKSRIGEAAGKVAAICHQIHGAMGFTQEHPLHFATRRLWSWRDEFGSEAYWEEWLGRKVCAGGGDALWDMVSQADQLKLTAGLRR